ncbi:MAG: indolepyruvate ferredoxin oxidoreductase, partial [Sulfurifustis sp.]
VLKNGYSSATGTQNIVSTPLEPTRHTDIEAATRSQTHTDTTIETTLKGMGVGWLRTVHTYRVADVMRTLREAFTTPFRGLKVIVAEGECQLERQRRIRPLLANWLKSGRRAVRVRYGVDEDLCTGDHSCIRLSGCPSLTIKTAADPLKIDPVATVDQNCVGCGLCGEVAHAAVLCPSFYRVEVIQNPTRWERWWYRLRASVMGLLQKEPVST